MSMAEVLAISTLAERYRQRSHAYAVMGTLPIPDSARMAPEHLVRLCEAAIAGRVLYPHDKLERWCGYIEAMLVPLNAARLHIPLSCRLDEQLIILGYSVSGVHVSTAPHHDGGDIQEMCRQILKVPVTALSHRNIGFVQGALATAGWIDVDTERDFSRPLLHAIHSRAIPTFS